MGPKGIWAGLFLCAMVAFGATILFWRGSAPKKPLVLAVDGQGLESWTGDLDGRSEILVQSLSIGSLTRMDRRQGKVLPGLAETWESFDQGKRYRFVLKQGIKASDGSPIDAPSFARQFERVLKTRSPKLAVDFYFDDLESITALSATELEFKFTHPMTLLPNLLSDPRLGYFAEANFQEGKLKRGVPQVSSGVWLPTQVSDRQIDFQANLNSGFTRPAFDVLSLKALNSDELVHQPAENSILLLSRSFPLNPEFRVWGSPLTGLAVHMVIRCDQPPWNDPVKRRKLREQLTFVLQKTQQLSGFLIPTRKLAFEGEDLYPELSQPVADFHLEQGRLLIEDVWTGSEKIYLEEFLNQWKAFNTKPFDVKKTKARLAKTDVQEMKPDVYLLRTHDFPRLWRQNMRSLFCSDTAILPDPGGQVCRFIGASEGLDAAAFDAQLTQILREQSCLIPVGRLRSMAFISPDLNLSQDLATGIISDLSLAKPKN